MIEREWREGNIQRDELTEGGIEEETERKIDKGRERRKSGIGRQRERERNGQR